MINIFSERLKKEREKKGWSQTELAEKIHISRQSVSKWETGKNYPSIEIIINLSDLFDITIDELLRSDKKLEEKVIQDSKQLAHPKWKAFFDGIFFLGASLIAINLLIVFGIGHFIGTDVLEGKYSKLTANFVPIALMLIGGIGSDQLKNKYKD